MWIAIVTVLLGAVGLGAWGWQRWRSPRPSSPSIPRRVEPSPTKLARVEADQAVSEATRQIEAETREALTREPTEAEIDRTLARIEERHR